MTVAKKKTNKGPERLTVHHNKERHSVFVCFYDGNLSGTMEITPEQAIAIGDYGNMAQQYRKDMEEVQDADRS
jgi:hypothetical protein